MKNELIKELVRETTIEDLSEKYQFIAEIIGINKLIELSEFAKGEYIYLPKTENIIIPARNRRIKKEYDGYNEKKLAEKYNLTIRQIYNILRDVPHPDQMNIHDFLK